MNRIVIAAVAACGIGAALAADAVDPSLGWARLRGTTDKPALSYRPGEEMVFTLEMYGVSNAIPADTWEMFVERTGDDGKRESLTVPLPLSENKFRYRTSIASNGFVRLYAQVFGKGHRNFYRKNLSWPNDKIFFDGGAGVNPDRLTSYPEPDDFDAFWAKRRERLAKLPIVADMKPLESNEWSTCYAVSVNCPGGRPSTFYASIPRNPPKKVRIHMSFWGYSNDMVPFRTWSPADQIVVNFNPHGFELEREKEYYREFYQSIRSGCRYPGDEAKEPAAYLFDYYKNLDRETTYFAGFTWRLMRAIQFLKTLPQWDGRNFLVEGGSQGGMQAIWAAGLDPAVSECHSAITWCCDLGGCHYGRLKDAWHVHWTRALDYYDPVNVAKRIPRTCRVTIDRAGLGDYWCPPSGLAVLYNNISAPKKIVWVQGSEHAYSPPPRPDETFAFQSDDY